MGTVGVCSPELEIIASFHTKMGTLHWGMWPKEVLTRYGCDIHPSEKFTSHLTY